MTDRDQSDEWLMGQVALGNREHLEPLIRRHASPLLTYLERTIGDRHRAEELFQDVFLAIWTKRKTYQFPRRFRPWLFAIATNRCRTAFRRAKPAAVSSSSTEDYAGPDPVDLGPSPVDVAVTTETATLVSTAIAQLPTQQRMVVVLRHYNGLSYAEIAQIAGRSEATVRSNMHHALKRMRTYLETRMDD